MKRMHVLDNYMSSPGHPITINVVGAGGTGWYVVEHLRKLNLALQAMDHPGVFVRVFDGDRLGPENKARIPFNDYELGQNKAVAVVNRQNREFGFNWEAVDDWFTLKNARNNAEAYANIIISCVDKVAARREIAEFLIHASKKSSYPEYKPRYWIDTGNSLSTGQLWMGTVGKIQQPTSEKYTMVDKINNIVEEYGAILHDEPELPSCSTYESLTRQDLFINGIVAQGTGHFLWKLLNRGYTTTKGMVVNSDDDVVQGIPL
jgi:PRTRC genetic system ThiF family protein